MTRHRLSPHFTVEEFDCHDGRRVPAIAVPHLEVLCFQVLEPLRARFGPVTVHSGYRHAAYNAAIHGARRSYHVYELRDGRAPAADVECARGSVRQWWDFLDKLQMGLRTPHGGLGYYPRGNFCHVDQRAGVARWDGS